MKHEEKLCYRMSHIASVAGFICLKKGKSYGIRFLPLSELVFFIEFQANANVKQDFITHTHSQQKEEQTSNYVSWKRIITNLIHLMMLF